MSSYGADRPEGTARGWKESLNELIRLRAGRKLMEVTANRDSLLSVTKHPEVGAAIIGRYPRAENQRLYVYELRIPKLETLHPDDNRALLHHPFDGLGRKMTVPVGGIPLSGLGGSGD